MALRTSVFVALATAAAGLLHRGELSAYTAPYLLPRQGVASLGPAAMPASVEKEFLDTLAANKGLNVVTHVNDGWKCLLANWAHSFQKNGSPGMNMVVLAMDRSALALCKDKVSFGELPLSCVNASEWGEARENTAKAVANGADVPGMKWVAGDPGDFSDHRVISMWMAKPTIVTTATRAGFDVIYSDVDMVFQKSVEPLLMKNEKKDLCFSSDGLNSGLLVAPGHSDAAEAWLKERADGKWVGDQEWRFGFLEHQSFCKWNSSLTPTKHFMPVHRSEAVALHYTQSPVKDKAKAMLKDEQWHVKEGQCKNYPSEGR